MDAGATGMRPLTTVEQNAIRAVFKRLNRSFKEWPEYHDDPHALVTFAFYEGCGGSILVEAAPLVLGDRLVREHGFAWVMVGEGDHARHAVVHPKLAAPIVLASLEDGAWVANDLKYQDGPGQRTNNSYENIVLLVGGALDE
jgi:hypothetical protein